MSYHSLSFTEQQIIQEIQSNNWDSFTVFDHR